MLKNIIYFFNIVSRGYSLTTSITAWLVVFCYCLKNGGNILNGIIALIGIFFAHLGANLWDDVVDTIMKVPKQKCKTEYLDNGLFSIKFIIIMTMVYFSIALLCGGYLFLNCGFLPLIVTLTAALLILLYPRLNHYALGEFAVAVLFGPLLFLGVSLVMLNKVPLSLMLISLPVGILIMNLLLAHSIMDYEFDKVNNKNTLAVKLKSQKNAIILLIFYTLFVAVIQFYLIYKGFISYKSLISLIPVICFYVIGVKELLKYTLTDIHSKNDFIRIFKLIRNGSVFYNIMLGLSILW